MTMILKGIGSAISVQPPIRELAERGSAAREFDWALDMQARKIAALTPRIAVSNAPGEQHAGKLNGITYSTGPYNGSNQVEMTIPGKNKTNLHLIGTYGRDGARSFEVDLLPQMGTGVGFTMKPGGKAQWHTTDGANDTPISSAQAAGLIQKTDFQPAVGLTQMADETLAGMISGTGAGKALNQLAPKIERVSPLIAAGDTFN